MSQSPLPDDPERWPTDPFQVLGVPREVTARDLKRAYTQLIRQYKPEQKPEEFRRIRQAYEIVRQFLEWDALGAMPETGADPTAPVHAIAADNETVERHWRQAIEENPQAGYDGLCQAARDELRNSDLPLRLYWLRKVFPVVDPDRSAVDWLIASVRQPGANGRPRELLRRELADGSREALTATEPLIDADWPMADLCDLAAARWLAASRLHELNTIRRDLDRLQPRVQAHDEAAWFHLQIIALDAVAWWADEPDAGELQGRCHDEVRRLEHRAMNEPYIFDRFDYLFALASAWRTFRRQFRVPITLAELIPISWTAPVPCVFPLTERVLEEIVAQPVEWLSWFDKLWEKAPIVLDYVTRVLQQYSDRLENPPVDPHSPTQLARLAAERIDRTKSRTYASLRATIMEFCLAEFVTVEMVVSVAPPVPVDSRSAPAFTLTDGLARDWPLRLVCWANRMFWA